MYSSLLNPLSLELEKSIGCCYKWGVDSRVKKSI
jgi:hypothetical protein